MKTQKKDLTTVAYEKGVQDYLKEVAESGSDVHENYTPAEICDMMLDKVDLTKTETVLVLYNIELLFALRKRKFSGHVTFFTQSQEKAGLGPKIFSNLTVEYIDKKEDPLLHMENKWPDKFDIVIANPPYSNDLDLKFIEKTMDIIKATGEALFLHPAKMYIDQKNTKGIYNRVALKVEKNLKSLEIFNGNGIFEINMSSPCCIAHFLGKESEKINVKNHILSKDGTIGELGELHQFGPGKDILSIIEKIKHHLSKNKSIQDIAFVDFNHKKKQIYSSKAFWVGLDKGRGNRVNNSKTLDAKFWKKDFFTFFSGNGEIKTSVELISNPIWFEFDTLNEAENFNLYLKTFFARMCLGIFKKDIALNSNLKSVPLVDFTQEWTDEKLYVHFNITEEEQAFIKEVIPPYYD
jgi:hypothetical protein